MAVYLEQKFFVVCDNPECRAEEEMIVRRGPGVDADIPTPPGWQEMPIVLPDPTGRGRPPLTAMGVFCVKCSIMSAAPNGGNIIKPN